MAVATYYWRERRNFGDLLGPLLLRRFSKLETSWSEPADAELVTVGSVIEHLPYDWTGTVAGAGRLYPDTRVDLPRARIIAVRGPLSAQGLGTVAIGDPGLLADELIPTPEKSYELGVVAHWSDRALACDPRFTRYEPLVIDVREPPLEVIRMIGSCRKIVASSLHAIILADAFGIPRRIEIPPPDPEDPKQKGGLFKWLDYSASLGMDLRVGLTQEPDYNVVTERQHELFDVFSELRRSFSAAA